MLKKTKKLQIAGIISISVLALLALLFTPLFFINQILFPERLGSSRPDKIYIQDYNPLAPKIYWINENTAGEGSNTIEVVYVQLTRTGLWSFSGYNLEDIVNQRNLDKQDYTIVKVNNISKEDLIKKLEKEDISKNDSFTRTEFNNNDIQNRQKQIDEYERLKALEDNLPVECDLRERDLTSSSDTYKNFTLNDLSVLKITTSIKDLKSLLPIKNGERSGLLIADSQNIETNIRKLSDPQYPKLKLVQLYFGNMEPNRLIQPEDKLSKIFIVLQDCTRIEIPTKPDGTFDFEAMRSQWE